MADRRAEALIEAKNYNDKLSGKFYRHFKGGVYYLAGIAIHSETAELLAIYMTAVEDKNAFLGFRVTSKTWARPLDMFLSEVDHEKYPEARQRMRFEEVI